MMRRLVASALSTPRLAAAFDAAQSRFPASRGAIQESLAAWGSEQMSRDVPLWRLDPLRRNMSYMGQKGGTPNSSAKGRAQQRKQQEEKNAHKAQKLLSQSPLVPDNVQANGTEGTPLKGWQPKGGMVAGHPVELPDIEDDPTLAPAKQQEPDHSVFDQLKALDPVFEAVALVPWLPNNEEGHRRRDYIQATVLDKLETKGWDVRGPVSRVWEGERDLERTLEGKDSGTRAALTAILYHVKKFDAELGDFREYAKRTE